MPLVGFGAVLWWRRGRSDLERGRWRWLMFGAGLAAFFTFCLGGFIREASRNPMTVYGEIEKPEATAFERDRFLVYETCLGCHGHHDSPTLLAAYEEVDWAAVLRDGDHRDVAAKLSEEERARLVQFLEEHYE